MKYLSDYTKDAISKVLKDNGAFFAFSNKQFDEQKQPGVKYAGLVGGLVCPVDNKQTVLDEVERVNTEGIKQDVADHTVRQICWREFANHEIQFTGDLQPIYDTLLLYPIGKEEIDRQYDKYYAHCIKHSDRYF